MTDITLRAVQEPLEQQCREAPESAVVTLRASGHLGEGVSCSLDTGRSMAAAGRHPAADVRGGTITAEGDLDFRGTLAVDKEASVGFREIRLA